MVVESDSQRTERYSRHLLLPQVGAAGQQKLREARVLVVGAGGLGAPSLTYLAAAGVGTLGVIDDDVVDISNLQRQVFHRTDAIGRPKVDSAVDFLRALNPNTNLLPLNDRIEPHNVFEIIDDFDIVVDGTDNFATRYLLNDACVVRKKPYVWAAIFQFNAVISIFHAGSGPCYRCIYPSPPPPGSVPSCAEGGVIGALPGLVGTTQALETIKLILDVGTPLRGRLASYDGLDGEWQYLPISPSPHCPSCAAHLRRTADDVVAEWTPAPSASGPHAGAGDTSTGASGIASHASLGANHNVNEQHLQNLKYQVSPTELAEFLSSKQARLIDVRQPGELDIVAIPGSENIVLDDLLAGAEIGAKEDPVVIMCRSGQRSAHAADHLRATGYEQVYELTGGVLAWVEQVSPNSPTY